MQLTIRSAAVASVMLGIAACSDIPTEAPPPSVTPTQIAFHVPGMPLPWVAYQDGGGPWTEVPGVVDGTGHTYSLSMTAPKGGIAYVLTTACHAINWVYYGTPGELKAMFAAWQLGTPAGLKTVLGTVAGGFPNQLSNVSLGGSSAWFLGESGTVTLRNVPAGPRDLVASRTRGWNDRDRFIVRRSLDVPDGDTVPLLDFNSAEAIALDSARLMIHDVGGNAITATPSVSASVFTANGAWGHGSGATTNGATWFRGLPASATVAGDMHQVAVSVLGRSVQTVIGPLANHAVALGPPAATPTLAAVSSGPPMRNRLTIPVQPEYSKWATARFETGTRPYYSVNMNMTGAYRGSSASWVMEVPDFGSASGYNTAWGLQGGPRQLWTATVIGWDWAEGVSTPAIGQTRRTASSASTFAGLAALPSLSEIGREQLGPLKSSIAGSAQLSCLPE